MQLSRREVLYFSWF